MKRIIFLMIVIVALTTACRTEKVEIPAERMKNLNGSWRIVNVTRNGADITTRFNFAQFKLNFADSAHTIENPVPFVVSGNGLWSFDDPQYPFKIQFTPKDSAAKTLNFLYPIVNGKRNILMQFSPGCSKNFYQYTFQRED